MKTKEGDLDHPIYFSSRHLSQSGHEGIAMLCALHKFLHYLFVVHFNFFSDQSTLNYLVSKPILEGHI